MTISLRETSSTTLKGRRRWRKRMRAKLPWKCSCQNSASTSSRSWIDT